jgi:hypothetical protein
MSDMDLGKQLYETLSSRFRERDDYEDLKKLLAVKGRLLDLIHATLEQRMRDNFPDAPESLSSPISCEEHQQTGDEEIQEAQPWLLPYFAELLDVHLASAEPMGRHAEIAKAVFWRQRKGTLPVLEDIAEQVSRLEVELQEGWRRVAATPRVGEKLLPVSALGEEEPEGMDRSPSRRALHPGLPSVTPDFRRRSRAIETDQDNPAAQMTNYPDEVDPVPWRLRNPLAVPCFPGSYQDLSRRTLDSRTPFMRKGLAHHRRVLAYFLPPVGHQHHDATLTAARLINAIQGLLAEERLGASEVLTSADAGLVQISLDSAELNGLVVHRVSVRGLMSKPVRINGGITFDATTGLGDVIYRFENLWFENTLALQAGKVEMCNCVARRVELLTEQARICEARLETDAELPSPDPALDAVSCLFNQVIGESALLRFEYCTVLYRIYALALEASDCIFLCPLRHMTGNADPPSCGCVRYSRVEPSDMPAAPAIPDALTPVFRINADSCTSKQPWFFSDSFGDPYCGVLHPHAEEAVRFGAEDGGEMGAFHDRRIALRYEAMKKKLGEFLPIGMELVLTPDMTLACAPPELTVTG